MFIAAILPVALLFMYIWKRDIQKEPTSLLVKAVLYGAAICIPVAVFEQAIHTVMFGVNGEPTSLVGSTAMAFFVAALPEESFKLLVLWLILRKNPFFDEHFDGIVYAVCVGLGFAAIENLLYVFNEEDWVTTAVIRSLLSVPGHYAFAVLMGYYYSLYHFVDPSPKIAACILIIPTVAHGIYDAIAMSGEVDSYIGSISFFVLIYFCIKMHKFARTKIVAHIERDREDWGSLT